MRSIAEEAISEVCLLQKARIFIEQTRRQRDSEGLEVEVVYL